MRLSKRVRAVAALALAIALFVPLLATTQAASSSGSTGQQPVIIGLKSSGRVNPAAMSPAALGAYVSSLIGGQQPTFIYQTVFHGFAAKLTSAQITSLRRNPNVSFVEPDYAVHTTDIPTGIERIEAPQNSADAGNFTATPGTKAVNADVAILDTGIGPNSDLNVVGGVTCTTRWFGSNCSNGGSDDNGHGTHVAGTVAGEGINGFPYGVAPGARLWAVKVLDSQGNGAISTIIAGLDWIAQHSSTIEVVNMSFGCSNCESQAFDNALNSAAADGLVLVAAAGNNSQDASNFSPANNPHVIAVSAVADYDGLPGGKASPTCTNFGADDSLASFSNFGSTVSIAAPGVCIESTWPNNQTAVLSGTSMASPHVAGAAALYIATYGTPQNANRWSTVRNGILSNWTTAQNSPCGYSTSQTSTPMLLLAPCNAGTPPSTGTISGTVTDASTHAGINNATITVQPANKTTTTNSSGSYSISNVPAGSQTVAVSANGYTGQSQGVTVSANTTTTQNFSLSAAPTTGTISGTITDLTTGLGINGASVSAGGQSTSTGSNGSYTLSNVPSGSQNVSVTATNYASGGGSVTVNAGQTTSGANFALTPKPGTISGTVTDSNSNPLQGVSVGYNGNSTTTNVSGDYSLSNIPAETSFSVTASLSGYNSQSKSISVAPGGSATANFSLTTVATSANGTLTGRVTAPSGNVSGATVQIASLNLSTTTNSSGIYSFSSVPAGNYSVSASGPWYYNTRTATVTISGGQTTAQNFALGWWFQP